MKEKNLENGSVLQSVKKTVILIYLQDDGPYLSAHCGQWYFSSSLTANSFNPIQLKIKLGIHYEKNKIKLRIVTKSRWKEGNRKS